MQEETKVDADNAKPLDQQQKKCYRDIFVVRGTTPTAINLDQVKMITLTEKRITLTFGSNGLNVDLDSQEIAEKIFEDLIKRWAES